MSDKKAEAPKPEPGKNTSEEKKGLNVEGKQTAGPIVLFVAAALATVGSVFALENLKPAAGKVAELVKGEEKGKEWTEGFFEIDPELSAKAAKETSPNPETTKKVQAAEKPIKKRVAALRGAVIGFLFCTLFGIAMGVARMSPLGILLGLVGGAVFGAASGVAGGFANEALSRMIEAPAVANAEEPGFGGTFRAWAMHGALWGSLCVGVALTVFLTVAGSLGRLKSTAQALFASVGAALIATALFPFLAAIAMPNARPEDPFVLQRWAGMMWIGMTTGLIAISVGRTVGHEKAKRSKGAAA